MTKIFTTSILIFIAGIRLCSGQDTVLDHSFMFLDKNGLMVGYDIQYKTKSNSEPDSAQQEKLFAETRKIASAYGREIPLSDFYFKRDSVEKEFGGCSSSGEKK